MGQQEAGRHRQQEGEQDTGMVVPDPLGQGAVERNVCRSGWRASMKSLTGSSPSPSR